MSSVFLTEVDDFLETSQACINPLFTTTTTSSKTTKAGSSTNSSLDSTFGRTNDDATTSSIRLDLEGGGEVITKTEEFYDDNSRSNNVPNGSNHVVGRGIATRRRRPQRKIQIGASMEGEKGPNGRMGISTRQTIGSTTDNVNMTGVVSESNLIQSSGQNQKATVSVADCLACSGCVTSAEAVLVNNHSLATLKRNCSGLHGTYEAITSTTSAKQEPNKKHRKIAFTISPAVLVELVRLFGLTQVDVDHQDNSKTSGTTPSNKRAASAESAASIMFFKLVTLLYHKLGANLVVDGQTVGDISLLESAEEFVQRYRKEATTKLTRSDNNASADIDVAMEDVEESKNLSESMRHMTNERKEGLFVEDEKKEEEKNDGQVSSHPKHAIDTTRMDENAKLFVPLPVKVKDQFSDNKQLPSMALSATKTRYILQTQEDDICYDNTSPNKTDAFEVTHEPGRQRRQTQKTPMEGDQRANEKDSLSMECEGEDSRLVKRDDDDNVENHDVLPMLTSSCPGFVCYVEKTAPYAIPHLSSTKSQMALAGFLIKHLILTTPSSSCSEFEWYHVAVMPCHDKKLEASRKDLAWESIMNDGTTAVVPDVDLVITTSELLELILEWALTEENDDVHRDNEISGDLDSGTDNTTTRSSYHILRWFMNKVSPSKLLLPSSTAYHDGGTTTTITTKKPNGIDDNLDIVRSCRVPPSMNGEEKGFTASTPSEVSVIFASGGVDGKTNSDSSYNADHCHCSKYDSSSPCCHHPQPQQRNEEETLNPLWNTGIQTSFSGSSGGYADFLFRYAAYKLFHYIIPPHEPLPWQSTTLSFVSSSSVSSSRTTTTDLRRRRPPRKRELPGGSKKNHGDLRVVTLYYHKENDTFSMMLGEEGTGTPVLTFATAYGFKNIQGVLHQLKKTAVSSTRKSSNNTSTVKGGGGGGGADGGGQCDFHYVEVMACPSGCLNGGGQVRSLDLVTLPPSFEQQSTEGTNTINRRETPTEKRERLTNSHSILDSRPVTNNDDVQSPTIMYYGSSCSDLVRQLYQRLERMRRKDKSRGLITQHSDNGDEGEKELGVFNDAAQQYFHTTYHFVPRLELTSGAVSGVAVNHTKW